MFLTELRIQNLRSIKELKLDFSGSDGQIRRRTVMLGVNGCGKSTALRAIALLLAGSDALAELLKDPGSWVRNRCKAGIIGATLQTKSGEERRIEIVLRPEWNLRETLRQNEEGLAKLDDALKHSSRSYFVLGYGVARRPSYNAAEFAKVVERGYSHPRARALATLFNPEATLVSFEQWAMDMDYKGGAAATRVLASAMRKLLPGMKLDHIDRRAGKLLFRTADGLVPFQQLSDGYQNVANWCGDILYRVTTVFEDYGNPLKVRGLLLVDELDLHLHPVWQQRLMKFLNDTLPNMQIVATSHSPLIAQQLREDELYVVERTGPRHGAIIRPIVGDPSRLTLPQLLSPVFGIDSVESLRVQQMRERVRAGSKIDPEELSELADMETLDRLPIAMRKQVKATQELTSALSQAAGIAPPALNPAKLRARVAAAIKRQQR